MHRSYWQVKIQRIFWQIMFVLQLPLLPIALWQGTRLKRSIIRFPEASGDRSGALTDHSQPDQPDFKLQVIGESPAAGVGIDQFANSLAPAVAQQIHQQKKTSVLWQAIAKNGATLNDVLQQLSVDFVQSDLTLIVMGVNDSTGMTSTRRWQRQLSQLITRLRQTGSCEIAFSAPPPLNQFPALPNVLGWILGTRSRIINLSLGEICIRQNCHWVNARFEIEPCMMAADGFHPSRSGVQAWSAALVDSIFKN